MISTFFEGISGILSLVSIFIAIVTFFIQHHRENKIKKEELNEKYLLNEEQKKNSEIKIIQEWNKQRPSIKFLLRDFRRYLINQKIKELTKKKELERRLPLKSNSNKIWIEKLLNRPISDFRKNAINLILAPYLVNIKKLSYQESFNILIEWLKKCDSIRKLDFNSISLAKSALNIATQKKNSSYET